jgi:hypothetical protein
VSTPFSFEYVFRAPSVTSIATAYFDPDHNATQDKLAQLGDRVVVEDHETDTLRKTTWRVTSLRQLPVIARPFVSKGGRLTFIEMMSWNKTTNAIEMSVTPEILGGRVQIAGAYELTQIGEGQVRRIYKGTITASITLVGGKIERGILETFTENMPAMAACTQGWLDKK